MVQDGVGRSTVRVVAILAAYNEERFIGGCLEHLIGQGVEAYLIDNSSTDRTVEVAEHYRGRGLIDIETFPRADDVYRWRAILERKEELAASLDADWFMHADPDEIRLPQRADLTISQALTEVDGQGYNAVNFLEFTFIPTLEEPDHDHPDFYQTMRHYYPFARNFPSQIKAWKRQPERVVLAQHGGHRVVFPELRVYPESFKMKHYQFLSVPHALDKYVYKKYDASEIKRGLHGWRVRLDIEKAKLPSQSELHIYTSDDELDISNPRGQHVLESWALPKGNEREPERPPASVRRSASVSQSAVDGSVLGGQAAERSALPIIVGGCYRAGTSLIRSMLDAHSRIYCGPEVKFFQDFHSDYIDDPIRHVRYMTSARRMLPEPALLKMFGRTFVALHERAAARAGKPRWADKSPENVLYLEEWGQLMDEDWLFVHVVRNPLDALASIQEAEFPPIHAGLDARIKVYKRYIQAGLDFKKIHPERYFRLAYEELMEDRERVLSDLMKWLGEKFEPLQTDFDGVDHECGNEDPAVVYKTSVHPGSVARWKNLLTPEEAERIVQECGSLWRRVIDDPSWSPELQRRSFVRRRLGL